MTKSTQLIIEFLNKSNSKTFELKFDLLLDNEITHRWVKKVKVAQRLGYRIDDPNRFYGFESKSVEINKSLNLINRDIDIINSYQPLIDRHLTNIQDQNTLNYLHHIFEVYHGLLDQQQHEFWNNAPDNVKEALSNLNIHVHRCESAIRKNQPRFVVTYFGLPKKHKFKNDDYKLLTNEFEFGNVYINYVEIGKTLEDYWRDRELDENAHAGQEAFRPFTFFSADFVVKFHGHNKDDFHHSMQGMRDYFQKHEKFFTSHNVSIDDECLRPGFIPVAKLNTNLSQDTILSQLANYQYINRVYFS